MKLSMFDLKRCKNCDERPEFIRDGFIRSIKNKYIECHQCDQKTPYYRTELEAFNHWNKNNE